METKKSYEEAKRLLEEIISVSQMMLNSVNDILEEDLDAYLPEDNDGLKKVLDLLYDV